MNRDKLFFALLIVSWAMRAQAGQPVNKASPKIGDIANGKEVTCIWIATFKCVDSYEGGGMRGTYGLLGTPLSKDTTTEASLEFREEKDLRDAKLSLSFQSGDWSFHARNLRYIPPDGGVVRVGGGIVKTGKIDGDIFRNVDLTLSKDGSTATFSVEIDSASAALKFPVTYPALEMKNITHVIVSPTKKQKDKWEACFMSGWVDVPLPMAQKGSAGADASATRRVDFVRGMSGLRDPRDENYAEWTVTRICQQPPKLAHDPSQWPTGFRPPPPIPANPTPTPKSPNIWDDWFNLAIEGKNKSFSR